MCAWWVTILLRQASALLGSSNIYTHLHTHTHTHTHTHAHIHHRYEGWYSQVGEHGQKCPAQVVHVCMPTASLPGDDPFMVRAFGVAIAPAAPES